MAEATVQAMEALGVDTVGDMVAAMEALEEDMVEATIAMVEDMEALEAEDMVRWEDQCPAKAIG